MRKPFDNLKLQRLMDEKGWLAEDLADKAELSKRTVERDLRDGYTTGPNRVKYEGAFHVPGALLPSSIPCAKRLIDAEIHASAALLCERMERQVRIVFAATAPRPQADAMVPVLARRMGQIKKQGSEARLDVAFVVPPNSDRGGFRAKMAERDAIMRDHGVPLEWLHFRVLEAPPIPFLGVFVVDELHAQIGFAPLAPEGLSIHRAYEFENAPEIARDLAVWCDSFRNRGVEYAVWLNSSSQT